MMKDYTLVHVPGHVLVCKRCGAMVAWAQTHTDWHREVDVFHARIELRRTTVRLGDGTPGPVVTESRDSEPMKGE